MHVMGRRRRVAFLKGLRAHVKDGGPILVSFFTRPPNARRFRVVTMIGNRLRWALGRERLELGDYTDTNYVHCFTEPEIAPELSADGCLLEAGTVVSDTCDSEFGVERCVSIWRYADIDFSQVPVLGTVSLYMESASSDEATTPAEVTKQP